MQKDIFQIITDFDELLECKAFDELSIAEKEKVLQCITPEEYEQYRNNLFILKSEMKFRDSIEPKSDIKQSLMQAYDRKYGKKKVVSGLIFAALNHKLPVYQVSIAAALIIVFLWYYNRPEEKIRYVNTTDTVYVEKPIYVEVKKKHEIEQPAIKKNKSVDKILVKEKKVEKPNLYKEYLAYNILSKMQSIKENKCGQSIKNDSMIMSLMSPAR